METQIEEELRDVIRDGDSERIEEFLDTLDVQETARAVCDLSDSDQAAMLTTLNPEAAAELLEELPDVEVTEVVGLLEPETTAAILHELPSDEQADVFGSLDHDDAEAVLAAMDPQEAEQIRQLASYPEESAGGLMATELFAIRSTAKVGRVINNLRTKSEQLRSLDIQYAYVIDRQHKLVGVLRLRDLLLADEEVVVTDLMINEPLSVTFNATLIELENIFSNHAFLGIPVTDELGKLVGVVSREAVDEAWQDHAESDFRRSMGMIEEEIRSMPTLRRSRKRLSWLSINIVLNMVAASVIAGYQETLSQVIALAVFLPVISDMSGCSGNQAVAVSMRELSLGLVEPFEHRRVMLKEALMGLLNGTALGLLLGTIATLFTGNIWLGAVVGVSLALNTLVAVIIGGTIPLVLKRFGVDPALAAGPILTTATDMFGFFLVLSIATAVLPMIVG